MAEKLKITIETPDGQKGTYEVDRATFVFSNDLEHNDNKAAEVTGWQYPPGDTEELVKAIRFIADNLEGDERPEAMYIGKAINECMDEVLGNLTEYRSALDAEKVNKDLIGGN